MDLPSISPHGQWLGDFFAKAKITICAVLCKFFKTFVIFKI